MCLQNPEGMTDEQLVLGCVNARADAQQKLYERFSRKMFGVCLRYSSGREEAEDLLQEGFVTVFQKISSYRSEGSLEGWVRRIMVNTALAHFRQQKMKWTDEAPDESVADTTSVEGSLETRELLAMIQTLPAGFRTVFNLFAIEGYTHREIGQMLGISENTSKSQYSRARVHLMKRLTAENEHDKLPLGQV